MKILALWIFSLASAAAPEPPIGGASGWGKYTDPAGDKASIRSDLVPLNPFENVPVGGATTADTMCFLKGSTAITRLRDVDGFQTPGMDFKFHNFPGGMASGDLNLAPSDAALNWTFRDASAVATYASANFLVRAMSGASGMTWQTATNNKAGNGENNILFVSDAIFESLGSEFSLPQDLTNVNAITLVWYEPDEVHQGPGGMTIAISSCKEPLEADIIVRATPKAGANTPSGFTSGNWIRGHSIGSLLPPEVTSVERLVSLTETLMHEMGHAFTLQHPRRSYGAGGSSAVGDGSVASIMADLHPHGGGLLDRDSPRESFSSDGGRLLPADVEWVRDYFPLNGISTVYLTNEHTTLDGGEECRDPNDTTQPSLDPCVGVNGGDWRANVVFSSSVSDPTTTPPTVSVQIFQKVAAESTGVWQSSETTTNRNVHDVDVTNTTLGAVTGFNACRGERIDAYEGEVPDELRIVNLGPLDVEATVTVDLVEIDPADRTSNATFKLQHEKTYTFTAGSAYKVGTNFKIKSSTPEGWYKLRYHIEVPTGLDAPLDPLLPAGTEPRAKFDDTVISQVAMRVWSSASSNKCP